MRDIIITVDPKTRKVKTNALVIGVAGENLQGNFIVDFVGDDFIDGACWLEFAIGKKKTYCELTREENTYYCPIKSGITQYAGTIETQVRITQTADESTPIFKSDKFLFSVLDSINATEELIDKYSNWFEEADAKIAEVDEALADLDEKVESGYFKGEDGEKGDSVESIEANGTSFDFTMTSGEKKSAPIDYVEATLADDSGESGGDDSLEALEGAVLNLASTTPEIGVINEAGIHTYVPEIELELQDGRLISLSGRDALPITAGDGIEFKKNANNTVSINAKKANYGAENAGKFLRVGADGAIVVETIASAEGVSV